MAEEIGEFLSRSMRESGRAIVIVGAAALSALVVTFTAAALAGHPLDWVVRDPVASGAYGRLGGIISTTGVVLWAVSGAIALFAASQLPASSDRRFLALIGAVSLWMAVDDQLMIHEGVSHHLPAGEMVVALLYAGGFATLAWVTRHWVLGPHLIVLVIAVTLLAGSLVADAAGSLGLYPEDSAFETALEDSLKFLGIAYWAAYFVLTSRTRVMARVADAARGSQSAEESA